MAVAADPGEVRRAIFELREQGVSIRNIAGQLGLSAGKVQRELAKPAGRAAGAAQNGAGALEPGGMMPAEPVYGLDPELRERQRGLALKRLALQETRLELDALEQQQRLALMQGGAGKGGDSGQMVAYLMGEISRVRERIDQQAQARGSAGIVEQLKELRDLGNTVALFAPPAGPTSPADVEFKLGLRRLDLEEQRIASQREQELALRQREVDSVNLRNDALAKFIEGFGPMLQQVAAKWLEDHGPKPGQLPAGTPALAVVDGGEADGGARAGEVAGQCPACGVGIAMIEGERDSKCGACGTYLDCEGGVIRLSGRSGAAAGGQGPAPIPTVTF